MVPNRSSERTALRAQAGAMLPILEAELRAQVRRLAGTSTRPFHEMLAYHMGWREAGKNSLRGKRVRPLLTLLTCASISDRWREAVPAAAAVELVHNFSLVHDDIQDNSPTRRGRASLWKKTGVPLAINAGDALFTVAMQAALDLSRHYEPGVVVTSQAILQQACLDLTRGQYLDLSHQNASALPLRGYWEMIQGKTAALTAAAAYLGALLAGASAQTCAEAHSFGELLGLAFQVKDDLLGIWGDAKRTGKSTISDLAEGKLSLPVVYGLNHRGPFKALWRDAGHRRVNARRLRKMLEDAGAREYAEERAARLTRRATDTLHGLRPRGDAGLALHELTEDLLARRS